MGGVGGVGGNMCVHDESRRRTAYDRKMQERGKESNHLVGSSETDETGRPEYVRKRGESNCLVGSSETGALRRYVIVRKEETNALGKEKQGVRAHTTNQQKEEE